MIHDYIAYIYFVGFILSSCVWLYSVKSIFTMIFITSKSPLYPFKHLTIFCSFFSLIIGVAYSILNYRWIFFNFNRHVLSTEELYWTLLESFELITFMSINWLIVHIATYDKDKKRSDRY